MNQREIEVLDVLWSSEQPMTITDIINKRKGLSQSTVSAVLRKLLKDKLVEVAGFTYSGKVLSRTYKPTEASKDALLNLFVNTYLPFSNVISLDILHTTLICALKDKNGKE